MLLGADSFGRDVFSRLLFGARVVLNLPVVAGARARSSLGALGGRPGWRAAAPTTIADAAAPTS